MLVFISAVFSLFWIVYRHNYYFVQRTKVDTHGQIFDQALSQLLAGVYVLEITLIGLFFIVRNEEANVACTPQAIIMIIALCLTAGYHFVLENTMAPLHDLLPVTLEDKAADRERRLFMTQTEAEAEEEQEEEEVDLEQSNQPPHSDGIITPQRTPSQPSEPLALPKKPIVSTAANARRALLRIHARIESRLETPTHSTPGGAGGHTSRKMAIANDLGAAIARFPDKLLDLTPLERAAEVRAAYQDPVTREPAPVVWIPQDTCGCSEAVVNRVRERWGGLLGYSNSGAFLTQKGKCEVVQPAPDVRGDWLLDWVL